MVCEKMTYVNVLRHTRRHDVAVDMHAHSDLLFATLPAAFAAGAIGGVAHCTLMCGGIPVTLRRGRRDAGGSETWLHSGRITAYTMLAGLTMALGTGVEWLAPVAGRRAFSVATGLLLLFVLLPVVFPRIHLGRRWTSRLSTSLRHLYARGRVGTFAAGMVWGLMPCMFSWAAIIAAGTMPANLGIPSIILFGIGTWAPLHVAVLADRRLLARAGPRIQRVISGGLVCYGLALCWKGLVG